MGTTATLWSVTVLLALLTLTPGLDTTLVVRTAALGRRGQAWGVVAGIQTGTLTWGVLSGAGVAAVLTASAVAYEVLRWAGAAYLVWLGLRMLWASRRGRPVPPVEVAALEGPGFAAGWRRGALTNLLNPKVGAFYVALLPQLLPAGAAPLPWAVLLAGIHVALGTTWSAVLVLVARRLRGLLQRPGPRRLLDRVTATVVTAFGVRVAVSG